jgi:beta-glucosidase
VDRCDRALDGWLAAGLRPSLSLFYLGLPGWLEERGGWMSRDTALRFADFAAEAVRRFGDRVPRWVTFADLMTPTLADRVAGMYAPGRGLGPAGLPSVHHVLLGHGLAVRAMRAAGMDGEAAVALPLVSAYAATDDPWDRLAVERLESWAIRLFLDPLLLGEHRVPEGAVPAIERSGCVHDGDLEAIAEPLDQLGLYWHGPIRITAPENLARVLPAMGCFEPMNEANRLLARLGFAAVPFDDVLTTSSGWPIVPEALADGLAVVHEIYGDRLPPLYLTDCGTADIDEGGPSARLADRRRRTLAARLGWLAGVMDEGVDVRGYEYLSVMDDLAWKRRYMQLYGSAVSAGRPLALPAAPCDWAGASVFEPPPRAPSGSTEPVTLRAL